MIPETNPYNNWSGNGSTTTFDFDFYIEDETQLVVYHTDSDGVQTTLTLDADYSINEVGNENGSYITFPLSGSSYDVLEDDEIISLCLTLPISQENEFGKSSYLNLETLEYSLDYLTRICQIIKRYLERCVKIQEGASDSAEEYFDNFKSEFSSEISAQIAEFKSTLETIDSTLEAASTAMDTLAVITAAAEKSGEVIESLSQFEYKLTYKPFSVNTGETTDSGEPDWLRIKQKIVIETNVLSDGISDFTFDSAAYFDNVSIYGDYVFTYTSGAWYLDGEEVTLSDYGISFTETFEAEMTTSVYAITAASLDEEQFLSTTENVIGKYNFLCTVIDGNKDSRVNITDISSTLSAGVDSEVYFDSVDEGEFVFTYKGDTVTYEDEDGVTAENTIVYNSSSGEGVVGSMVYDDEDDNTVITNINYEYIDGGTTPGAWYLDGEEVDLADYGITVLGNPDNGCSITVTVDALVEDTIYWTLNGTTVDLSDYGITYEGEETDGDLLIVTVTSSLSDGDTITVTVYDPEDDSVQQEYYLETNGEYTVTTAAGTSYTLSDELTYSITDLSEGAYNVYIDPVDLSLSVLDNTITANIAFPSDAADGDYLLNASRVPYDLEE